MPTRAGLPLCLAGIGISLKVNRPAATTIVQSKHPRAHRSAPSPVQDTSGTAIENSPAGENQTASIQITGVTSRSIEVTRGDRRDGTPQWPPGGSNSDSEAVGQLERAGLYALRWIRDNSSVDPRGVNSIGARRGDADQTGTPTAAVPIRPRQDAAENARFAKDPLDLEDEAESEEGAGQGSEEEDEDVEFRRQHHYSLENEIAYWDTLRIQLRQHSHPQPGLSGWPSPPSSPPDHSGRALPIIRATMEDDAKNEEWKAWGAKAA